LVLLILGILAIAGIAGSTGADMLKSNLGFIVKVERQAPETEINRLKQTMNTAPYVASYVFSSAEEIMAAESEYLGEDITSLIDINPYGAEFDVKVKPEYASVDSIEVISASFSGDSAVETVLTESTIAAAINSTLERVGLMLVIVAVALLVISIVLINNTVHLAVYSRRFVIHTMKLVGATGSFIRKPFVMAGAVNGVISAAIASVLLVGMLAYGSKVDPLLASCFSVELCAVVIAGMAVAGVVICTLASLFATNRYLRANYDDMFMK
jgi:cell division transport system permease protein